jgi:hypothetical protein
MRHILLNDEDAIILATVLAMAAENHEDDAGDPGAPGRYRNLAERAAMAHSVGQPLDLDDDDHDALTVLLGDDEEGTPEHDLAARLAALVSTPYWTVVVETQETIIYQVRAATEDDARQNYTFGEVMTTDGGAEVTVHEGPYDPGTDY